MAKEIWIMNTQTTIDKVIKLIESYKGLEFYQVDENDGEHAFITFACKIYAYNKLILK